MKIGWIVPTVGAFGAVREMVEVSNLLVAYGHEVTIYHPQGGRVKWLPSAAETAPLPAIMQGRFDVVIGILDWMPTMYATLLACRATIKCVCVMGFTPSGDIAAALRGESKSDDPAWQMTRDAVERDMLILADSPWQVDWLRTVAGIPAGPAFGGINLKMFAPRHPGKRNDPVRVLASNDPRGRKGSDTVKAAVEILCEAQKIDFASYWNQRFDQQQLVGFLHGGDLFLDGHIRGGWCNPVIEAMACGCAVVCTDIGATSSFAIDGVTALTVPVNDASAMAAAAQRLINSPDLCHQLTARAIEHIQQFSYERVVPKLERALLERLA